LWIPLKEQIGSERRPKDKGYFVDDSIVLPPSPPSLSLSLSLTFSFQALKRSYDKNTHAFERPFVLE
jgi:hypothetical protein